MEVKRIYFCGYDMGIYVRTSHGITIGYFYEISPGAIWGIFNGEFMTFPSWQALNKFLNNDIT